MFWKSFVVSNTLKVKVSIMFSECVRVSPSCHLWKVLLVAMWKVLVTNSTKSAKCIENKMNDAMERRSEWNEEIKST